MKKSLCILIVAFMLMLATPLLAQDSWDMSELTCAEINDMDSDALSMVYFWVDGYFSHASKNTTMNLKDVETDMTELLTQCSKEPKTKLLDLYK